MGPYDHVEIAVIRDKHVYGFWLTNYTKYAVYGIRPHKGLEARYATIDWYRLEGMTLEEELGLIARCSKMSCYQERVIHPMKMMMSAFPIQDPELAEYWLKILDPTSNLENNPMRVDQMNDPASSYCAAVCGEVLGLAEFDTMTPNDLVEACKERYQAKLVNDPFPQVPTSFRDPANIIRSRCIGGAHITT